MRIEHGHLGELVDAFIEFAGSVEVAQRSVLGSLTSTANLGQHANTE
jgi:hypothetical protein